MTRAGRIAIVGRPNVGKSTLLNALLGEPIAITSAHPQTTRDEVRGVLTRGEAQFVFVDTPGLHAPRSRLGAHMNETARAAMRDADAVVLVIDASRPSDDDEIARDLPARSVLVLNKVDKLKDKTALLPMLEHWPAVRDFAAIVPLSARRADGTDRLLKELGELVPEQPFLFEDGTLTDQPARFFVAELVRERILEHTRQEVPHGVAVVVERFDEGGKMPHIEIAIHVAREAHKKIVIGAGAQMLKRIGTEARARVEAMLGCQVNLKLWVRATPGWMDDAARLRELGYPR